MVFLFLAQIPTRSFNSASYSPLSDKGIQVITLTGKGTPLKMSVYNSSCALIERKFHRAETL